MISQVHCIKLDITVCKQVDIILRMGRKESINDTSERLATILQNYPSSVYFLRINR